MILKVSKVESDMLTLKAHSLLKEDAVKLYRDDTSRLIRILEEKQDYRIFFDCSST